jgi:hypothetical protein
MQGTVSTGTVSLLRSREESAGSVVATQRKRVDVIKRAWIDELERLQCLWYMTRTPDYYNRQKLYANFPAHLVKIPESWKDLASGLADLIRVVYHGMLTPFFNLEGWARYAHAQIRAVYKTYKEHGVWFLNRSKEENECINAIAYLDFLHEPADMPELFRHYVSVPDVASLTDRGLGMKHDDATAFIVRDGEGVRRWAFSYPHHPCWLLEQIPRESQH